jgi:hypothetical protein
MIWVVTCSNGDEMAVSEIHQPHAFNLAERKFNNPERHVTGVRPANHDEAEKYGPTLREEAT